MKLFFFLAILSCLIYSCGGGKENASKVDEVPKINNISSSKIDTFRNIVVLLDLSSRVRLPNQDKKDIAILQHILQVFESEQRVYGFQISKDKLDVKVALQDGAITQPFDFGDDLTIDMTVNQMNKPNFDVEKSKFTDGVIKLYQQAISGPTTGADIWNFFDDKLKVCIKNNQNNEYFKNKIIIISDGYLEFDTKIANSRPKGTYFDPKYRLLRNKNNWSEQLKSMKIALSPCGKFNNVEVLMLEVAPFNPVVNVNELQIIQTIWENWFSAMNIKSQILQTEDNSDNLKETISKFISK